MRDPLQDSLLSPKIDSPSPQSPHDLLAQSKARKSNIGFDVGSPPSIIQDHEYEPDLSGILSPSEFDNSVESGTPRETWITEAMRNNVLNKAKSAEVSLLSDDSEWDRV